MKWRNFSYRDSETIIKKLGLERTNSKRAREPMYRYPIDGDKGLLITMPNRHGRSSLRLGFIKHIRDDLMLNNSELEALVDCHLSAEEFDSLIRERSGTD